MSLSKKIIEEVIKVSDTLTDKNKNNVLDKIKNIVMSDDPKPRTQALRYSLIKKHFKDITKDEEFLKKIKPSNEIIEGIIKDNDKTRDDKPRIEITEDIIKKIIELEKSNDLFDLAIYLLFISGRRTSELLTAEYINIKGSKEVGIRGVKKRTDRNDCIFSPLIKKTKFFKIYNRFKKLLNISNKSTFSRTLNRRIKKKLGENLHPHTLRGIYALYSFKFKNKTNKKINTFIRDALCHQSIQASLNYTGYNILFNKDFVK